MRSFARRAFIVLVALNLVLGVVLWNPEDAHGEERLERHGTQLDRYHGTKQHLAEYLSANPKADANRDGVLTMKEMRAYKKGPAPDFVDLRYGEHERNVLNLWTAVSDHPTPLVLYFHGGGFVAGDKSDYDKDELKALLARGISVAAVNYRFTTTAPYPAPMHDAARAVQFLRLHAKEYNLDPARFAAVGCSAGGIISLWLAFHDDLADANNADAVLQQSSRLACAAPNDVPTTLDPEMIREWMSGVPPLHPALLPFYGIKSTEEFQRDDVKALVREASPINLLGKDDPPVYLEYRQPNVPLSENASPDEMIHHPLFGVHLKKAMDAIGVEAVLRYPEHCEDSYTDKVDFLARKLK